MNKTKVYCILLVIVIIISGTIRLLQSVGFDFPFTYDQARDMLDLRVLAGFHDLRISGPTTSIPGLNLGPYYYIFNLPAFWAGAGNPQFLVMWNILWFLVSGVAIYKYFEKRDAKLGFIIAVIFLTAPQLFAVTRYFWNANSVVYFIVFYFLALWRFAEKKDAKSALIWGISAGLVIQFEAAFGSMCVAFSLLTVLLTKNWKVIRYFFAGLLPWFIPQCIYEITHGFRMTRLFIFAVTGQKSILGQQIPLEQILGTHWKTMTSFFEGQFMLDYGVGFVLIVLSIFVTLLSKKYRRYSLHFLSFFIFAFFYFSLIYRHELKDWYLEGIRIWYCFVFGIASVSLLDAEKYKKIFTMVITLFIIRSITFTIIDQNSYITDNGKSNDPKNTANIISAIDWIYTHASGAGFNAYNYVPEIHDYSESYLYWWYGNKTYGYVPNRISYSLVEVPGYIRNGEKFTSPVRINDQDKIALIYETTGEYKSWLTQFNGYCIEDKQRFTWNMAVEWRGKCD